MKLVPVQDAVGMILGHDLTRISADFKGAAFKKGHLIQAADIPRLLDMGKYQVYVFPLTVDLIHENEAVSRIAQAAAGQGIVLTEPSEGKVTFRAVGSGLFKVNAEALRELNEDEQVTFAALHTNQVVTKDKVLGGIRIIPLHIPEESLFRIELLCSTNFPLLEIKPLQSLKVGLVTTGSEVYHGRITDSFGPVMRQKLERAGCSVIRQIITADEIPMIAAAVKSLISEGAELIAVTGGMSVDPDDVSPAGIRAAGAEVVTYGAPILPGAMFMLAYLRDIPVLGLPGCVMYHRITVFDLLLPRFLAGEKITRREIVSLGHGGLCLNCRECRFPDCAFGKGS